MVLNVFGGELVGLSYVKVENINPQVWFQCPRLQSLRIVGSCTLAIPPEISAHSKERFLPNLKKLESDICLENLSQLFQEKSSYICLIIYCCHVALKESEWLLIPKLWPNIENLSIGQSNGLTMDTADHIFPMFRRLRELTLPRGMLWSKNERDASFCLKEKLAELKVALKFKSSEWSICSVLSHDEKYELSSQESVDSHYGYKSEINYFDIPNHMADDWNPDYDVDEDWDDVHDHSLSDDDVMIWP